MRGVTTVSAYRPPCHTYTLLLGWTGLCALPTFALLATFYADIFPGDFVIGSTLGPAVIALHALDWVSTGKVLNSDLLDAATPLVIALQYGIIWWYGIWCVHRHGKAPCISTFLFMLAAALLAGCFM